MASNQTECSRLEHRSAIKVLVVKKCKPRGIYRRMCDMYGEAYFSQKNVYKWVQHQFATTKSKRQSMEWILW